ncbi:MAG: rhomboid family intramembrane serine protease [Ferruginibacter sp.]
MIPIGDNDSDRVRTPIVNYILIGINILVFVFLQGMGGNEGFTLSYATVPGEILTGSDITTNGLGVTPVPVYFTLISAMFMHGSIAHLGGNMLYLWIFGDNLENVMGHLKYLIFYLVCGIIASLSHVVLSDFLNRDLLIPSLGASGAISGVLGGYLLLFPKNQVRVFIIRGVINVPAYVTLGLWIVMQLISGWGMLGDEGSTGGVAYAAHIGGFIAGLVLVKFFAERNPVPASTFKKSG